MALALILHLFIGSTIAGAAVIAVLSLGYGTLMPIAIAGIAGLLVSFPVSWLIARRIAG